MVARSCRLVAVMAVALAAPRASADPTSAERIGHDAEALATAGDYPGAAAKYREAYREHPRPDLMCNVGVAYYKAKDLARAQRYLDQCLASGASLDPGFIATVKTVLSAVEQKLATGDYKPLNFIVQPPSATTTFASGVHDEPLVGPRRVWVPFGSYRVTVHAEGFVDRVLDLTAENRDAADYSLKLEPAAPLPDVVPQERNPRTALPSDQAPPVPAPRQDRSLVAPVIASASTGILGGLAIGFYISARSSATEAGRDENTNAEYEAQSEKARNRQHLSWGVGAVAGVSAIVAGYLWYRVIRKPSRPVEVSATPTGASVSFVGRW